MQASEFRGDNAPEAATDVANRNGAPPRPLGRPGLGANANRHHRRPSEESDYYAREIVHVAYRHSDLDSGRSQQHAASGDGVGGGVSSPSASLLAAARKAEPRGTPEGAKRFTESASSLRAQKKNTRHSAGQGADEGAGEQKDEGGLADGQRARATGGGPEGRQRSLLASEAFRMPSAIGNGVGWGWDRGPFGAWPECPSSPRVLQIGIAMDTGYFKVWVYLWLFSLRVGVKSSTNRVGERARHRRAVSETTEFCCAHRCFWPFLREPPTAGDTKISQPVD